MDEANEMDEALPEFERPPLDEVLCSLAFRQMPGFTPQKAINFWRLFSEHYPNFEIMPPVPLEREEFGGPAPRFTLPTLMVPGQASALRFWFLTADDDRVVQIQRDRITHNWRSRPASDGYVRFPNVFSEFKEKVKSFSEFCKSDDMGDLLPLQSEVTYINIIEIGDEGSFDVADWLRGFSVARIEQEDGFSFRIARGFRESEAGPWTGRMTMSGDRVISSGGIHAIRLALMVRNECEGRDIDDALNTMRRARSMIVHAFTDITTPQAHACWGRTR